jgi:hypothetical protein
VNAVIGIAFATALLFIILSVHAPSPSMEQLNIAFTNTLMDAISHCEAMLNRPTESASVESIVNSIETELAALRRGVTLITSPCELTRYERVSHQDALHLRIAAYLRGAWSINETAITTAGSLNRGLLSPMGYIQDEQQQHRILNLWDVRPVCNSANRSKLTSSTTSSSVSGSSIFSFDSIEDSSLRGISIRRLNTAVETPALNELKI